MRETKLRPRGKPWGKGISGNPKGRIPGKKTHDTIISEATRHGLTHMVGEGELTAAEALAHRRIEIGLRGKPGIALQAIEGIENRLEGRPTQAIQVTQTMDEGTMTRLANLAELFLGQTPAESSKYRPAPTLQGEGNFLAANSESTGDKR